MIDKVKQIAEHFGLSCQVLKFQEESSELVEAIKSGDKAHMEEELADVCVVMYGIGEYLGLDRDRITEIMEQKIDRTLDRIETGYYEVNNVTDIKVGQIWNVFDKTLCVTKVYKKEDEVIQVIDLIHNDGRTCNISNPRIITNDGRLSATYETWQEAVNSKEFME
jgi:NTP pyrophosphatase (non-canonical NTP hydrolase)